MGLQAGPVRGDQPESRGTGRWCEGRQAGTADRFPAPALRAWGWRFTPNRSIDCRTPVAGGHGCSAGCSGSPLLFGVPWAKGHLLARRGVSAPRGITCCSRTSAVRLPPFEPALDNRALVFCLRLALLAAGEKQNLALLARSSRKRKQTLRVA